MSGQFDNDTGTIAQSLREIVSDAKRVDAMNYDEALEHAQQRGTGSLLSIATQALTTPIQTATGEGFFTDIVVEWGALNGHADASRMLVEKLHRFTAAVKSLRHWANGEAWLARVAGMDDARDELIERRQALGEITQELIRFAESFLRTIPKETPGEIPESTYSDQSAGNWFGVEARTIRTWRQNHGFPKKFLTFEEARHWASSNKWAQSNNKRIVKRPN